ncbi:MAG: hypothetical protein M0D54_14070 [Hyphomonadaceae bacterium JAD_PAG50586_4]|nr:MAG: hypothetical protein M0D54_14070 [Hyphomonadaceae bacterium JAD_PAG50586_4]
MADIPQTNDPYAPPPRYKNKSGAMVRVALLAAMLAAAAWGYMTLQNAPRTALVAPAAEEQSFADAAGSQGYAPSASAPSAPVAPAATTAPSQTPNAAPRAPAPDPVPPPSTTIAPSGASAPLPAPADTPAGD